MKVGKQVHVSPDRPLIHLACSRGGHLDLLLRHQDAFEGCRVVWVTQQSARAEALRRAGAQVHVLGEWDRARMWQAGARAIWRSLGLVLRQRPRVVVTSGSGIVVPFCVMARLAGARVVFVETSARVRGASSSGRVLARLAQEAIAQWDDMRDQYRGAIIARTSIVEELATAPAPASRGTVVIVGTHSQPFDRLLRMVDDAVEAGILPEPVRAQVGPSTYHMRHGETRDFITPDEMREWIGAARYVVSHAGTGTISTGLRAGRRPLILGRLARHGEHFDDHQQQIVEKLATYALVVPVNDQITTADLKQADRPLCVPPDLARLPLLSGCLHECVQHALRELDLSPSADLVS